MNNDLKITWLGHSCFIIEYQNIRIMFDPFTPNSVPGLKVNYDMGVNKVFISHNHDDHNYDKVPCFLNLVDIKYDTIKVAHDECGGKLRGMSDINIVYLGDYKIAHMGDIGCKLTSQQISKLQDCDLMLIPINGFYTISAKQAYDIFIKTKPKVMVPMHYFYDNTGYPDENQLQSLLKMDNNIIKINKKSFMLNDYIKGPSKILVLDYQH